MTTYTARPEFQIKGVPDLNEEAFDKAVTEVIQERGYDFVYVMPEVKMSWGATKKSCMYFSDDGTPSCLFGAVFAKLGVDPGLIREHMGVSTVLTGIWTLEYDNLTQAASIAQAFQDGGAQYGEVLNEYRAVRAKASRA